MDNRRKTRRNLSTKAVTRPFSFSEYQKRAAETDHTGINPEDGTLISVLGIVGESGDLATLFKKKLRDGDSFTVYPDQCAEELGDILWYVSTLCTKLGFSLEAIAKDNLKKTKSRWSDFTGSRDARPLLDENAAPSEQIPRRFTIQFSETQNQSGCKIFLSKNGKPCGNPLTDNAHFEDGYRYHDVFHLAYAAVLGWSPVTRKLLGCKRKSHASTDEIEDGGRATVIEEAISALVFQYAEHHNFLDGLGRVDSELLSLIKRLTSGLEVRIASAGDWERAIFEGYKVFRLLSRSHGGFVTIDLNDRTMRYQKQGSSRQHD